ncbi:DUF5518 domain-containing protein [Halovenus halobia]|uniref:DUF5518 domain-containing protein n=1 Tax=Halovenus halobia TaxID=3396622 RepID=UPI003F54F37D
MRDTVDPAIEVDLGPVLWAAGVVIICGLVGNFVLGQPQLLAHGAFLAGVVSSFRSDYYQNSGNSAAIGTLFGTLLITPVLVYLRVVFVFGIRGTGDILFTSVAIALVWLILTVVILLPVAYIGSLVGDVTRKKLGGPLGY